MRHLLKSRRVCRFAFEIVRVQIFIYFAVTCIKTAIPDHFKVFLRYVPDQTLMKSNAGIVSEYICHLHDGCNEM